MHRPMRAQYATYDEWDAAMAAYTAARDEQIRAAADEADHAAFAAAVDSPSTDALEQLGHLDPEDDS